MAEKNTESSTGPHHRARERKRNAPAAGTNPPQPGLRRLYGGKKGGGG